MNTPQRLFCLAAAALATSAAAVETTAHATCGQNPGGALDADATTAWSCENNEPQELTIELGHPWRARSVELEWGTRHPTEYEVQISSDGTIWQTIAHPTGFAVHDRSGWFTYRFTVHPVEPEALVSHLRVRCLQSTNGFELTELRINDRYPFCYEPVPDDAICRNPQAAPEERVRDLLNRMTLREKISFTGGYNSFFLPGLERFGFDPVLMNDATSGLNLRPTVERGFSQIDRSTSFPLAVALAATWQPELAYEMGRAIAEECRASGTGILLGPGVNIYRTSTGGRNFEYMGEDPLLAARMAVKHIQGVQSLGIIATIKHFVANNHEFARFDGNVLLDERTLHEIYLPAFAAAVREGNVRAVMSAYNRLNGIKCGENRALLTDLLRGELGYTGFVMSDWGEGTEEMELVLDSGQNLVMPDFKTFGAHLRSQLAQDPQGTEQKIEAMIAPTLRVLFEMGTWDRPRTDPSLRAAFPAHQALARTIAESAITLLKNDDVLPLTEAHTILITGDPYAVTNAASGGGSGHVKGYDPVTFYEGLRQLCGERVTYTETPSAEEVQRADRVLFFVRMMDREGMDRPFELPEKTNQEIVELARLNPHLIVLVSSGTGFETPWINEVKGLVHGYFLGQEYGAAMARVLTGKVNPSGKLPFTIEAAFADSPAFGYNQRAGNLWWRSKLSEEFPEKRVDFPYAEGVFVGYRWYEAQNKPVRFPFGFGLSYTTFRLRDIKLSAPILTPNAPVTVEITVENTGAVAGAETVQLYIHDEESSVERPYRELKGFQKIFLQPGESRTVTLPLDWTALAFWDIQTHAWKAEPGFFTLLVGNSSRDVQCQTRIEYRP